LKFGDDDNEDEDFFFQDPISEDTPKQKTKTSKHAFIKEEGRTTFAGVLGKWKSLQKEEKLYNLSLEIYDRISNPLSFLPLFMIK